MLDCSNYTDQFEWFEALFGKLERFWGLQEGKGSKVEISNESFVVS